MRRHAGLDIIIIIGVIIAVMLNYYICESVFSSIIVCSAACYCITIVLQ